MQTAIEREETVEKALRQRPDLRAARQAIDIDDLTIRGTKNALLPDFRLTGELWLLRSRRSVLPAQNMFDQGATNQIISVIPGGLNDALGQLFGFGFPTYSAGVILNFPLRDRRAARRIMPMRWSTSVSTRCGSGTPSRLRGSKC